MTARSVGKDRVIEFVGLPGCGKTTVAKHILSLKRELPVPVTNGKDRTYSKKRTMLFLVRKFVPCVRIIFYLSVYILFRQSDASIWDRLRRIGTFYKVYCGMLLSFFHRITYADASGEVAFFEHGPINIFWMIDLDCGSHEKLLRKIIQHIQRDFGVEYVFFDISPAAAAERITQAFGRATTPFDRIGEAERLAIFKNNETRFRLLLRMLEDSGANCLVVDAKSGVEEKAGTILSWLNLKNRESVRASSWHPFLLLLAHM